MTKIKHDDLLNSYITNWRKIVLNQFGAKLFPLNTRHRWFYELTHNVLEEILPNRFGGKHYPYKSLAWID